MQAIRKRGLDLAHTRSNVVIVGEPGTGKSVLAEHIHLHSEFASKPFAFINLASLDELRLRSIVQTIISRRRFLNPTTSGHGDLDLPNGASLILGQLSYSSIPAQKTIIDLINGVEGRYKIRFIALIDVSAENRNWGLSDELGLILRKWEIIEMPSLRDRQDDIPELVEHFVNQTAQEMRLGEAVIDINAMSVLVRKEWKGNIEELKTFVEQTMMLSENRHTFMLPDYLMDEQSELRAILDRIEKGIGFALDRSIDLIEKKILERVLKKFDHNQTQAARFLKIKEDTLRYRMKRLGILPYPKN